MPRRVYFAFHYQDVADFRANVVRNAGVVADDDTFYDASLWEEAQKKGDVALKRLINSGLDYTSTTCVLVGSATYARRWVKYEIFKSFERGNALLAVNINSIPDKDKRRYSDGPNPLAYTGFYIDRARKLSFVEYVNDSWHYSTDLEGYRVPSASAEACEKVWAFSTISVVYDWVKNDGYNNFPQWIEHALAQQAKYSYLAKG